MGGSGCPISSRFVRIGKASLSSKKLVPILASADEDIKVLMILHRVWMAPLLVRRVGNLSPLLAIWTARKNGLWLGYVHVLHIERTH